MGRAWVCGLLVVCAVADVHAETPAPRWPLDLPPVLTSSFGEYRSNHLHAGIDLGTGGRIGAVCHATADGSVVRMRMSPYGYGKALYIQTDGGPLVVYGHLSRFAAPMAGRARAEQERLRRYTFDINLQPGEMRVHRGDIVAWSGQTGVGFPHLHFELRDGDVARNPQTSGFAVPDTIAPIIDRVYVTPLDPQSHVGGGLVPQELPPAGAPALVVGGRIGFSMQARDHATSREYRQSPYRYELRVDGQPIFRLTQERFDYDTNHLIVLEYDQERLLASDALVQLLYVRPGDRVMGREAPAGHDGEFVACTGSELFAPGPHAIEIQVADVAGHVTVRRGHVLVSCKPTPPFVEASEDSGRMRAWCVSTEAASHTGWNATLACSRDDGRQWQSLAARPAPKGRNHRMPSPGTGAWAADLDWDGRSPILVRGELRNPDGVATTAIWYGAVSGPARDSNFTFEPVWRARWVELQIVAGGGWGGDPPYIDTGCKSGPFAARRIDARRFRVDIPYADIVGPLALGPGSGGSGFEVPIPLRVRFIHRSGAARVTDLDSGLVVEVPAGALLDDVALRAERVAPAKLPLGSELHAAGPCLALEPATAALDAPVVVKLRPGAPRGVPPQRVGLFWINRSGELKFLAAERDSSGMLRAETHFFSRFAALADTTPPRIGPLVVQAGSTAAPHLAFTVHDAGADLGDGGIATELDGAFAVAEWDPETGQVVVEPEARLARGTHRLRVVATDQLGNRRERVLKFTVP